VFFRQARMPAISKSFGQSNLQNSQADPSRVVDWPIFAFLQI
jgi:hypothetical protein